MKKTTSLCLVTLLFVLFGASTGLAATVTETFDSYANGTALTAVGGSGVWTIGANTVVNPGGVNGTAGLGTGSPIFNWKGQPFQWSTLALGTKVAMSLDFQSSATGKFDDDRVGWTITPDASTSTGSQLALQLDNTTEGGMVFYHNLTRTPVLDALSGIKNSTWYRFNVEFTKLTATSAGIVGTLTELDGSGNPTGTPYVGTIADTSAFANPPSSGLFTATQQCPSFKNYNTAVGNADNATFTITLPGPQPPTVTLSLTGSPMAEAGGVATVTATLSETSTSNVTVNLAFSGTATLTDDYTRSGASISIPAGSLTGSITLAAVQDTVYESPVETIVVGISAVDNAMESGTQQVTATITDDDPVPPVITLLNENFDSMGSAGTALPAAWTAGFLGAVSTQNRLVMTPYAGNGLGITAMPVVVSDGSALPTPNVGTVFNLGSDGNLDRALGGYPRTTPSGDQIMQVAIVNTTGDSLTTINVSYAGEQWRQSQGTSSSGPEMLRFLASTTSPTDGFTYFSNLDFTAPKQLVADWPVGGLDGNLAANRAVITGTITFASAVPAGGTFYLRWHDWNDNETSDHFLAIDDVIISSTAATEPTVTLDLSGSPLAEAGGAATVTATLSETSTNVVTVNLAFAGTATLTTDYTRSGASISIPPGNLTGSITLTAVQDTVYESPAETIVMDISTVVNAMESGTQQVTATITDDDPTPAGGFTAYNDCSSSATTPANTTQYRGNGTTSGLLKDSTAGTNLPVTLTINANAVSYDGTGGPMPNVGTDAYDTFNGNVVFDDVIWYTTASNGFWMDAVFTGLDPAKEYEFATSVNRGGSGSDYGNRFSKFTISDIDSADNASTPGVTINSATSVTFCSGSNSVNGYVARWIKVKSGADGDFTVRVEDGGGVGKGYAFDGIMLRETGSAGPQPMVAITSPANNAIVSTNFTITATATDDGTVTNVYFYDGSTLLGNDDTEPYTYTWNPAPVGSHTLTAVAWDNDGWAATSAVVNVIVTVPSAATFTETFDSYANRMAITNIGGGGVWTSGTNIVLSTGGVNGSGGLSSGNWIFNWKAHTFQWSTLADGTKVAMSLDFQSSATGKFDDDRVGWTITPDASTSTGSQLALQLDNTSEGGIVFYHNLTRTPVLNDLSGIKNSTWYRFHIEFTKLTATSAGIVGTLTELDGSGNPTGTPYVGTVTNTATFANPPTNALFTATQQCPSFKNYNTAAGNADNATFTITPPPAPPPVTQYVIIISVDGLGGTYLNKLFDGTATGGSYAIPNFMRLKNQGAGTLAAHCDNDNYETLPNHVSIMTGRPQVGANGHNWTLNGDPAVGQTIHSVKGSYVASGFDVAHDNGLRTGMYANKSKFSLFDTYNSYTGGGSYNATYGAPDTIGADNGPDKIDNTYINTALGGIVVDTFIAQQQTASSNQFALLHINEPDSYGHSSGWGSATWNQQVTNVDMMLGKIFKLIEQDVPAMIGKTAIILTADHGNQDNPPTGADRYAVPFYVWGPGVPAGADLYALNVGRRQVAASYPMNTYDGMQPIRNAEAANLALDLLGLGAVPGSTINSAQDLLVNAVFVPPSTPGIFGNTNDGTLTDAIGAGWINACRFQAPSNMTVATMHAKVTAITGKYKCAIYGESASLPSGLLRSTVEVTNPATGWQTFALTGPQPLTNGSYYWLAIWSDADNAQVYYSDTSSTLRWVQTNYATSWPNPIATTGEGTAKYCIYARGAPVTLVSIAVTPANPTRVTKGTQQFTATGTYSEGSTANLTSQVAWNSSSTAAATINSSGLATAVAVGTSTISATLGGVSGNTLLTVQPAPLTITATSGQSKVFGAADPTLTYVSSDPVVTLTGALSRAVGENVGPYAITQGTLSAGTNYSITFISANFAITPAASTAAISSSLNPSAVGSNVMFTVTVGPVAPATNTPTGKVQFLTNGVATGSPVTLVAGVATLSTALLPAGTNTVTANYLGEGNYLSSSDSLPQVVTVFVETPSVLGIVNNRDGSVTMTFAGTPGAEYLVLATTNLASPGSWVNVSINNADPTTGQWTYTDNTMTSYTQRFFRAAKP